MEGVIAPPIVVLIAQAGAHFQAEFRCDRDVAGVEQAVKIRPQQQPISHIVRPAVRVGTDVGSLDSGKRVLLGDGTRSSVRIEHGDTERGLPKARLHQAWIAVAGTAFRDCGDVGGGLAAR